jgi:hypothetical protein
MADPRHAALEWDLRVHEIAPETVRHSNEVDSLAPLPHQELQSLACSACRVMGRLAGCECQTRDQAPTSDRQTMTLSNATASFKTRSAKVSAPTSLAVATPRRSISNASVPTTSISKWT